MHCVCVSGLSGFAYEEVEYSMWSTRHPAGDTIPAYWMGIQVNRVMPYFLQDDMYIHES